MISHRGVQVFYQAPQIETLKHSRWSPDHAMVMTDKSLFFNVTNNWPRCCAKNSQCGVHSWFSRFCHWFILINRDESKYMIHLILYHVHVKIQYMIQKDENVYIHICMRAILIGILYKWIGRVAVLINLLLLKQSKCKLDLSICVSQTIMRGEFKWPGCFSSVLMQS